VVILQTERSNRIDDAARLLVAEVQAIDASIMAHEKELAALRARRARAMDALRPMRGGLSAEVSAEVSAVLSSDPDTGSEFAARSEKVKLLLSQIRANPLVAWSPEQVRSTLGGEFSEKYTANTMRRLSEEGLLVRVGRGLYKASNQLVAIEGLTEGDFD
jgi:hypothetical protein